MGTCSGLAVRYARLSGCIFVIRWPGLSLQGFRRYLADFPRLREAGTAACEGLVTEYDVYDALKQVSLNKSPGLDGLLYVVYLSMSHMFVPILTNVVNH